MASLRDTFSFADPGVSQQGFEELQAQNMGAVRKSYEGSRVGNVANAAAAQLASLRAEGRHAEADVIQAELEATQQRMGAYAPEVGKVENIGSAGGGLIGDGLTWVGEAAGQVAGSMQDPLLAATAMNAGGRLLGMSKHPAAQLASKALTWGAPAVGFGLNYDQSKGEFVQNAMRDPELMARTSWQDLNRTAQTHGVVSGAMDTALPALLGRQLTGKAGMAALSKMAPTSFGGRTLAAMGLEGATEFAQGKSSQFGLGHLNPDRDTTGDFSEDLNNFAGGVFGSGPTAAAGALAEGGHERLGGVANALGKKAGDTVDLATGAVDSAKEKGRSWWDRLTGGKEAEDLQGGEGAQALDPREIDVLLDKHLDPQTATDEDFLAADVERTGIVVKHLRALAESNDRAADLLGRVMDPGAGDQVRALDESANFLKEHYNVEELDAEGNNLGRTLGKAAGAAGTAAVKGAARVVKNVVGGMVDGARSKKNLQADEGSSTSYTLADWEATQASRRSAAKQALASTGPSARKAEQTSRMNLAARQAAEFARTKYQGKEGLARMASHTAFELIDASRDFRRSDVAGTQPGTRNARLGRVADTMRRLYGAEDAMKMADTIASIVGQDGNKYLTPAAEYVKAEIQRLETPEGRIQAKQERAELVSKIAATVSPQVHQKLLDNGVNLYGEHGEQFLKLIEKLADGTGQPEMRHKLNGMIGSGTVAKMLDVINESDIAKGKDEKRQKASPMFGETADEQEILGEGFQIDDDGEVTDYEKRQGEKQVGKTSAPKLYGYKNTPVIRSSVDWRNPFAGAPVSKAALAKWRDSVEADKVLGRTPKEDPRLAAATRRPSLFALDDKLTDERNAIEARIEAVKADLGEKSASWSVEAKKASDLLGDMKVPDAARISLYRDYLRKAVRLADEAEAAAKRKAPKAGAVKVTAEQKAKWDTEIEVLGRVLKDMYDERNEGRPDTKANVADEDGPDSSGIKSLGKERFEAARKRADEARQKYQELRKKYARAQEKHDANRAAQDLEDDVYGEDADESFYEVSDEDLGEFAGTAQAQMLINAGKAAKEAMAEYQELASAINAQNAPPPRTGAVSTLSERRTALRRADNYFANRYLVVAEDMTNRAPEDISLAEVRSMTNKGLKAMDFARKITSEADSQIENAGLTGAEANQLRKAAKREHDEVVDAYNILEFAPLEGDKPVYIKAGDLVYWARTQRNKSEVMTKEKASKFGRGDLDREYLDDLMTGISTILASGAVGPQMPVKRNKFGKPEAFETPQQGKNGRKPSVADSVPDSLRLVTMTAGQMRWKPDDRKGVFLGPGRPDADARADEDYQAAVVKDQRRREEPAVVDPLQDVGEMRTMDPQDYAALTPDERKTLNGFADRYAKAEGSTKTEIAREQREFLDGLSLRKDGKRYSTAVDTTSSERQRDEAPDILKGEKPNPYTGESHRAVYKDAPKQADQIRRDRRMRNADGTKREVIEDGAEFPVEMTDDEISPLDFFPDQEPGAVPDEFADAQFRNRIEGYDPATTVSAEHKMSAAGQAKERGDAIRAKLLLTPGEDRTELTPKQLEGINSIAARIRSAYRPERREKGDAGPVGGWHYLYPAARALNADFLDTLADGKDPAGLVDTLEFLRGQLTRALLESSATPKQKVAIAKLMAPKTSVGRINEGNIQGTLERNAPARDDTLISDETSRKPPAARQVDVSRKRIDPDTPRREGTQPGFFGPDRPSPSTTGVGITPREARPAPRPVAPTPPTGKGIFARVPAAAPEVAAQEAPKAQAKPSGAGGVDLGTSGPYTKKDQAKSDQATKFIGRGSERSSTAKYAKAWGDRANTGQYTADDVVFISAEGNRGGRVAPDFAEVGRAVKAGATVITDSKANRERDFNVGEREVAKFLTDSGYREVSPGRWQSAGASIASRARHQGVKVAGILDRTLAAASNMAAGRILDEGVQAWRKGVTYKQFLASPEYLGAMHGLMVHKLMGTPGVQTEIDELNARAHQMFAIKYDKELEAAVMSRLSATDENTPAKLRDMMREILVADVDPATKVIARAVNSIAGDVDVFGTQKADIQGNSGLYSALTKVIRVAEDADLGHAGTVLHEGVHAATVTAMMRDKGLHRAVYRLMDHVIEQNPRLRDAYGLATSLEFLAEGLANISFQRELVKIKPNDAVARYLGKTAANAWDAFVGMVRTALNLDPKHESALAQLLDLGGRAMLTTKANPSGLTHAEFETFIERGVAPEKRARELADAMVNSRQIEAADRPLLRQTLTDLVDGVVQDGLVPHKIVVAMAATLETFNLVPAGQTIELGSIFTALDTNINSDASLVPSKAGRKLNAQSNEPTLDAKLTSVLAERGITVSPAAMEGMPLEDRISLVSRTLQVDADQTMAPDVARFVSWMVIGSDFYDRVEAGIAGSQMEKDIMAKVDRDPRQSMYTPVRKRKEIVRQAVEQLLTYGLYKKYAQQGTLPQKLLALVKEAARYVVEALGGVPFRTLQAEADQLVDGILSGEIKLARPTKPGAVLMDPKGAFAEDQHAANIVYGLTEGGGFALTGSLAYAAQGTVYRPPGLPIHDLDLTTNLSQKAAEARLTRLYPQAHLVRSFGGMGSFVTTYVVPPKGHTISGVVVDNGAIKAYTVRKDGATVGRYEHAADGTETQTGRRATVVDLIGDSKTDHATMTIPTAFGEKRIPVNRYRDAMTEKLLYARDKDITDFANFVPFGRKLNAQSNEIHDDLGRPGFAATHDSPIRHEGKFDWRSHKGKGEGNAAYGAGTYLSTANGVHKSYKNQFTAKVAESISSPAVTAAMDRLQAIGRKINVLRQEAKRVTTNADAMAEAALGDSARIIVGRNLGLSREHDVYYGLREGIPWMRDGWKTGNRATDQVMEKLRKAVDKVFAIGQDSEGAWVVGERGVIAKVGIPTELIDQIKASADVITKMHRLSEGEFDRHVKSLEDLNTSVKQIAKYREQLVESRALAKEEQRIIANEMAQLAVDEDEAQQDLDWEIEKARKRGGHKYRGDVSPTYQVSVNIKPEQLLDWDKPLLEQSELVQEALKELKEPSTSPLVWQERGEKHFALGASIRPNSQRYMALYGADLIGWYPTLEEAKKATEAYIARRRLRTYQDLRTGGDIYNFFVRKFGSQTAASDYLQSLGILGHRFASSSGMNSARPNYVIFDDSKITTNYVHFNQQDARTPRDTPASPEEIAQAKAWMNKVLPKVRVEFEKLTGYSGEFIEAENLVKISTTAAAGVMQTAYHEGLHAFFAGLAKNPEALRVMSSIADNRVIFQRLQALLAKYPAAKAQLVDGEERLAYAFQFWAAGKLQLPVGPARGFFAKLRKFFRQVAGLIKDEEKAADIFQAFNDGKLGDPSTAGKVLNDILAQGTWTKKGLKRLDGLMQRVRQLGMPAEEILLRAPSAEAKALARQLFTNPGDEGSAGMQEGLLSAQRTIATKEMNRFANAIAGLDDKDMANVAKLLEAKTPLNEIPYAPYLKAVKEIRQQLNDFGGKDGYLQKSGMEMGTVKDDYFPRVWSLTKLIDDREGFVKMLMDNYPERLAEIAGAANLRNTKHGKLLDGVVEMDNKAAAEEITNYLIKRNGTDGKVATQREDGVLAPYFAAGEKREFAWIETQKSEPWQNKNLIGIMTGYLREGVRSAEYTRRFGRKGEHLDASLRTIEAELTNHARAELAKGEFKDQKAANAWVTRQMRGIRQATGAMEGSLGKDISDRMRKFNSWMMVYQNVRLLPLTLFASVVDPLGMIARGATMREAFEAFQRGIQEVFRGWADLFRQEPKGALSDKWTKLAEHIGAVDAAILSHHASEEYSSTYLSHGAKRINDAFFKINGMEAWNRGMRVGAVKAAAAFIARHKALPDVHSQRWLTELGLTPDQITLDGEGNLITDMQDLMDQTGVSETEAKRQIDAIHAALNRWTLSAVLTPNAAQRPAWSSDPHYSLFFHLKQFSYSFHQTILKRAVKEMNYGNMGPIATFAGYIPVMIASDVMKGLIMGGGTLPNHMQGMDLGDWVMHGLERSGTLGIGAIGVDASRDMFSVLGPGVEQLVDGITEPIADTTLRAMPLNPLVRAMAE